MKRVFLVSIIFIFGIFFFAERKNSAYAGDVPPISDSVMANELSKYSVSIQDFGRKEFYSWTTPSQIAELRNGKEFLSRSVSSKNEKSLFDITLSDTIYDDFEMAKILRGQQFAKKRFAWIDGWATVMGWKGENYGNQLLKVTLKDSAIIVAFLPNQCSRYSKGDKYFSFSDVNGNSLTEDFVLAHQNRIAAVYFCANKKGERTGVIYKRRRGGGTMNYTSVAGQKTFTQTICYREYVICNEQMIDTWESATENVLSEMNSEVKVLKDLQSYITQKKIKQTSYGEGIFCWELNQYKNDPFNVFVYSRAFPNDFYLLNPQRISAISTTMNNALSAHGTAISHTVK